MRGDGGRMLSEGREHPQVRARLARLKTEVRTGIYRVDPEAVADSILTNRESSPSSLLIDRSRVGYDTEKVVLGARSLSVKGMA
jgi:hypothetical protein